MRCIDFDFTKPFYSFWKPYEDNNVSYNFRTMAVNSKCDLGFGINLVYTETLRRNQENECNTEMGFNRSPNEENISGLSHK